jgi:uncharacterized phage protein (TIGR01671 family)
MREIKFRAFSKETGIVEISDNSKVTLEFNKISGWNIVPNTPNYKGEYLLGESQDKTNDFVLMQYTGLKDKNGKEIYEGDVVKLHHFTQVLGENLGVSESENEFIGQICFQELGLWIETNKEENSSYLLCINGLHEDSFEIIGNIYFKPELLKNN